MIRPFVHQSIPNSAPSVREIILVVSTKGKLFSLNGPLLVDTGDREMTRAWRAM